MGRFQLDFSLKCSSSEFLEMIIDNYLDYYLAYKFNLALHFNRELFNPLVYTLAACKNHLESF